MLQRIKFQGKDYLLVSENQVEGPICTKEQYRNGEESYAHLFPDGEILRFQNKIGTIEDIEFIEEIEDSEILSTKEAAINALHLLFNGFR